MADAGVVLREIELSTSPLPRERLLSFNAWVARDWAFYLDYPELASRKDILGKLSVQGI